MVLWRCVGCSVWWGTSVCVWGGCGQCDAFCIGRGTSGCFVGKGMEGWLVVCVRVGGRERGVVGLVGVCVCMYTPTHLEVRVVQLPLVPVVVHPANRQLPRRVRAQVKGEHALLDLAL